MGGVRSAGVCSTSASCWVGCERAVASVDRPGRRCDRTSRRVFEASDRGSYTACMPQDDVERTEHDALRHALTVFAAYREGDLQIDDQYTHVRFVSEPGGGRLIASAPAATFFASQLVLFVPEETDDALALLVSAEEVDESHATDRWLAFHLAQTGASDAAGVDGADPGRETPEHTKWALLWVDSAKHGPWVFDGDAFMTPNPAALQEPSLCKRVNARRSDLATLCIASTGADLARKPVCVGVDPGGLYVRLAHGVVRIPFPPRDPAAPSEVETLESLVDRLLDEVNLV